MMSVLLLVRLPVWELKAVSGSMSAIVKESLKLNRLTVSIPCKNGFTNPSHLYPAG